MEVRVPGTRYIIPESSVDTIPDRLGESPDIRKSNEKVVIAADSHSAGTPEASGIERPRPRVNGQRLSDGEPGGKLRIVRRDHPVWCQTEVKGPLVETGSRSVFGNWRSVDGW